MKILIISKDNFWTRELVHSLYKEEFECTYSSVCNEILIKDLNPDWVFFFHWSEIVTENIFKKYKCAVIHTGNLPEGRGGSPIQNQILEGVNNTKVNIIEMGGKVDSGRIYCSSSITLQGNLTDIWLTIAKSSLKLIKKCINENPNPIPQKGKPKLYKRIKNNQIKFGDGENLSYIYDQIRILDSKSYPNSYLDIGEFKLEFSRAKFENEEIIADVRITKK